MKKYIGKYDRMARKKYSEVGAALTIVRMEEQAKDHKNHICILKERLQRIVEELDSIPKREWTGWFVLLEEDKSAPSGFKCAGLFNPDKCEEEDEEPEWRLALPIPTSDTAPEFNGW